MRPPRMTMRRWMIAAMTIALVLGCYREAIRLKQKARRVPHAGDVARRRRSLSSPLEPKSIESNGSPRRSGPGADTFANSNRRTRQGD